MKTGMIISSGDAETVWNAFQDYDKLTDIMTSGEKVTGMF